MYIDAAHEKWVYFQLPALGYLTVFWEFPGVDVEEKYSCVAIGGGPLVSTESSPGEASVIWPESISEMASTGTL